MRDCKFASVVQLVSILWSIKDYIVDVILISLAGASKGGKSTLDEITNKVFEELLQGKPPEGTHGSDQGSVKVSHLLALF
jgi:hypothetical protein